MKTLRWLAVLSLLMFSAATAHADGIDIKVKGQWDFAFGWVDNAQFLKTKDTGERKDDKFGAAQRIRTQINFITSEYLQAVLMFEIGDLNWGSPNTDGRPGGALDADGVNVETKRAYLDWIIPNTEVSVRMGIQGVGLPMGNGWDNPVFSADVAGIVVSSPITDWLEVTAFWLRPFDAFQNDGDSDIDGTKAWDDEMDIFGLVLPITGDGWSLTPWGMYAFIGANSGYFDYMWEVEDHSFQGGQNSHTRAWWAGLSFELDMFDPLTFSLDAMYGHMNDVKLNVWHNDNDPWDYDGSTRIGTKGWFIAAALNYQLDWGTPGIYGWYASGDDDDALDDGKYGRMPVVGVDDGFAATSFGFPGTVGIGADTAISATGMGTWGVAIQLADVSFIEDLSHTLRFAYYRGTNDHELVRRAGGSADFIPTIGAETFYLTDKDAAFEINFDHSYQIYENLTAIVELGYINLDLDSGTWDPHRTDDAWKAQLNFLYEF